MTGVTGPTGVTGAPVLSETLLRELVALAESAARAAGVLVREGAQQPLEVSATKSSPTDIVTAVDLASEALLRERLLGARPQDGLLGEEGGDVTGSSGVTWVVDPVDGTVNYLYGLPNVSVSVAAVVGDPRVPGAWSTVAACVHAPMLGLTWTAAAGLGAWRDGLPQTAPEPPGLAEALVGTGFGYVKERRISQARVLSGVLPRVRDIRRLGGAAIDLCLVASGLLDAYYERGLKPWDLAGGLLVAQEAGAVVTGLAGGPPGEDMVVAAAGPLAGELTALLEELDADAPDGV